MASETPGRFRGPSDSGIAGARRTDSLLDTLAEYCYPLYQRLFDDEDDFVIAVDTWLSQALRDTTVELFLSRALAIGLIMGSLLWIVGLAAGYAAVIFLVPEIPTLLSVSLPPDLLAFVQRLKTPGLIGFSGIVFGLIGFAFGFGVPLVELRHQMYTREREINLLLPDTIAYMYALSVGGMNHIEILGAVADAEEVYGETAREFQTIVQKTRYFDSDYRTAIHDRASETPSEPLNQFLTDMLSIINSGGDMTGFLDEKADRHLEIAQRRQEETLDTLELIGEMYLAISLFPLLLIILLVVMALVGQGSPLLLYLTVYGMIPLIGVTFLVMISTIKQDVVSEGYLTLPGDDTPSDEWSSYYSVFTRPVTAAYRAKHAIFAQADRREMFYRLTHQLRNPHKLFVNRPVGSLIVTVPVAILFMAYVYHSGAGPQSIDGLLQEPVAGTVLYVYTPLFVTLVPLAVFHEWYVRHRYGVLEDLSETLRKLSSANDTGLTLLESLRTVAETSTGRLAREFDRLHVKVTYGTDLKRALIEFNNRYHIPRLARTVKLVAEAQETSSQITDVLTTAARASENQEELARDRRTRTRMQIAIIIMTYLTLLGVMAILKVQFLDVIAEIVATADQSGGGAAGIGMGGGVNVDRLSMLFFHAVTLQAIVSGLLSGYLRDSSLLSGVKYVAALLVVTLVVWVPIA